MKDYWSIRATKYEKLQWVNNKNSLNALVKFSDIRSSDKVLDLGCGTGAVSMAIINKAKHVTAVDYSQAMLDKFQPYDISRLTVKQLDVEKDKIEDKYNIIVSRMLFHHLKQFNKVFKKCYNALLPSGKLIIQEGGVINKTEIGIIKWYANMMKLKEDRHNFTIEELYEYYEKAGFKNIQLQTIIDNTFSINDWLENSGQDKKIQKKIYELHLNAPKEVKSFYNMRINNGNIIIDSRTLLIKGTK